MWRSHWPVSMPRHGEKEFPAFGARSSVLRASRGLCGSPFMDPVIHPDEDQGIKMHGSDRDAQLV